MLKALIETRPGLVNPFLVAIGVIARGCLLPFGGDPREN